MHSVLATLSARAMRWAERTPRQMRARRGRGHFVLRPVFNGSSVAANPACSENSANTRCLFDWRFIGSADSESPHTQFGRPYLVFDLEDVTKARIVSMGANGIFESVATGCAAGGDDLLLCLY